MLNLCNLTKQINFDLKIYKGVIISMRLYNSLIFGVKLIENTPINNK